MGHVFKKVTGTAFSPSVVFLLLSIILPIPQSLVSLENHRRCTILVTGNVIKQKRRSLSLTQQFHILNYTVKGR
jgi:hypothetical protein